MVLVARGFGVRSLAGSLSEKEVVRVAFLFLGVEVASSVPRSLEWNDE